MQRILKYYVSFQKAYDLGPDEEASYDVKSENVNTNIWGPYGMDKKVAHLSNRTYGSSVELVLIEFYVTPDKSSEDYLRASKKYKRKEKAFGIPVFVSEAELNLPKDLLLALMQNKTIEALKSIKDYVVESKIEFNIEQFISDVEAALNK